MIIKWVGKQKTKQYWYTINLVERASSEMNEPSVTILIYDANLKKIDVWTLPQTTEKLQQP